MEASMPSYKEKKKDIKLAKAESGEKILEESLCIKVKQDFNGNKEWNTLCEQSQVSEKSPNTFHEAISPPKAKRKLSLFKANKSQT
jgi:hypothetical protein